jgi:hypothetical protein
MREEGASGVRKILHGIDRLNIDFITNRSTVCGKKIRTAPLLAFRKSLKKLMFLTCS